MKFVCDRCQTRYTIADEKVRQRILRIRCKTCSNVITVQSGEVIRGPQDASSRLAPTGGAAAAAVSRTSSKVARAPEARPPQTRHEWYVAVDGAEKGPLDCNEAAKYIITFKPEQSVHVWKEGMDGWKRPKDVAIIAQEISALRRAPDRPAAPAPEDPPAGSSSAPVPAGAAPATGPRASVRPAPPSPAASGSGPNLPHPAAAEPRPKHAQPGSGPMATPAPVAGSGLKLAPRSAPGSAPKASPSGSGSYPRTAPPPIPGSGLKRAPAGPSGPAAARARVARSETAPSKLVPGTKIPVPASLSGPQRPAPGPGLETPVPEVGKSGPSLGTRSSVKVPLTPSAKSGPALPGLSPPGLEHHQSPATPAVRADFEEAPATMPDRRPSRVRGGMASAAAESAPLPAPEMAIPVGDFEGTEKTPPPGQPLPPIVGTEGGSNGKHVPAPNLAFAHAPALPQSAPPDAPPRKSGGWPIAVLPSPSAGSLFGDVAALPFPGTHAGSDLSKLANFAVRHRHLKYVAASGVVVVLVILVILFSWRGDSRKTVAAVVEKIERPAPAAATVNEEEPAPHQEASPTERSVGHKGRSTPRGYSKHPASARGASRGRKAAAVGDDPFEGPPADTRERAAPVAAAGARRGRSGSSGGGAISQAQISEVVRNRDNQSGIKTCYERALKHDGRLRTGRLDITVSIGESGTVQSVQVHGSADFMQIEGCIKNAIRHWRFPSNGEEYATSFPLILQGG
jgi:predicted Zn finger-like uncharacterized protein